MRGGAAKLLLDARDWHYNPGGYEAAELRGIPMAFSELLRATTRFLDVVADALDAGDRPVPEALAKLADGIASLGGSDGERVREVAGIGANAVSALDTRGSDSGVRALLDQIGMMPPSPVTTAATAMLEPMCGRKSFSAYLSGRHVVGYDEIAVFELAVHRLADDVVAST
jgi:hypothetical protein